VFTLSARRVVATAAAMALFVVPTAVHAQSDSPPDQADFQPIELRIATVEEGGEVSPLDPIIDEVSQTLDALESHCIESREQIGNQALISYNLAAMNGLNVTPMQILRHVQASVPSTATSDNPAVCGRYFVQFAVASDTAGDGDTTN
jgi:hypothetical protein